MVALSSWLHGGTGAEWCHSRLERLQQHAVDPAVARPWSTRGHGRGARKPRTAAAATRGAGSMAWVHAATEAKIVQKRCGSRGAYAPAYMEHV